MNTRLRRTIAVLLATFVTGTVTAPIGRAQGPEYLQGPGFGASGSGGLGDSAGLPGRPGENVPLPLGNPGSNGFFAFMDLVYLSQTWTLGDQQVAVRGFRDTTGFLTGTAGGFVGSGTEALNTNDFGRRTYMPGYNIGIGFKSDDGTTYVAKFLRTPRYNYTAGASLTAPNAQGPQSLADTFLFSPVFNFPPQYAGTSNRTGLEGTNGAPSQLLYGIWNGSGTMSMMYTQEYTDVDLGVRIPIFETPYSKVYGLAGGRMDWFFERFKWRVQAFDTVSGQSNPTDVAFYNNTLSQRLYGPYMGASHEIYLGKNFSLSTDISGALMANFTKERATYKIGSDDASNKRSLNDLDISPSIGGNINLWWYPTSGIQVRVGYQINTWFNTKNMQQPIGFDYSNIDPVYGNQAFRMIQGLNVGFGLFF
jgi:hypothetical protein